MQGTQVPSLGQEELLEEETATNASIVAWEMSWGHKKAGHD